MDASVVSLFPVDDHPSATGDDSLPPVPTGPAVRPVLEAPLPLRSHAEFAALVDRALADCRRRRTRLAVLVAQVDAVGLADDGGAIVRETTLKLEDSALEKLARRLQGRVRAMDAVVRIDSRTVGLVLLGAGTDEARTVAARLHKALAGPYSFETQQVIVALHIGCAAYPELGVTGKDLVRAAERA